MQLFGMGFIKAIVEISLTSYHTNQPYVGY